MDYVNGLCRTYHIRTLRHDLHDHGYTVLFTDLYGAFTLVPEQPRTTRDKVVIAAQVPDYAVPIKVEILFEERIDLDDARAVSSTPMQCLSFRDSIAEKLLANADRALDTAYFAKDLIDLAIVLTDMTILDAAIEKVHASPKGYDVSGPLQRAIQHFNEKSDFRR